MGGIVKNLEEYISFSFEYFNDVFYICLFMWLYVLVVYFFLLLDKFYRIDIKYFVYLFNIVGDVNYFWFLLLGIYNLLYGRNFLSVIYLLSIWLYIRFCDWFIW